MDIPTTVQDLALRKGRKFDQVLMGAREVFLASGFEASSMDDVARVSGVSKATLYSYFSDKADLFVQVVRIECARQAETALEHIDTGAPAEVVLTAAATHLLGFMTSPFGQRMYRMCLAESERFPQIGRAFYESGPVVVRARLKDYFTDAMARGELVIDDIDLAADQFGELCKADLFPQIVFGLKTQFSEADLSRIITGAVRTFMARYGTDGAAVAAPT